MKPVTRIQSRTAVLADENIDTDRIIPARFLTTTTRDGLGKLCFHDWRYQADGSDNPAFPLNQPEARGCSILVAGRNFGCGSSRENARSGRAASVASRRESTSPARSCTASATVNLSRGFLSS